MTLTAATAVAWAVPESEIAKCHPVAIEALYRAAVHRGLLVPDVCPRCGGTGWLEHYSNGEPDPIPCECNPRGTA